MKSGCETKELKAKRSVSLPILAGGSTQPNEIRASKNSRWRAVALISLNLLMIAHVIQWWITGSTISPIEPSEAMYTLQNGAVNAGVIFFTLAILATLVFGRFVCGWGCHIVSLQDLCGWLMKKIGITPRPFRSRLLVYVPLIVALYMFVWPTVVRYFLKPPAEPLFPQFTNHIVTTEFWATFPTVAVAIPFLFICGFMTVYFLGAKGFCTYGCPYGGFFGVADKFAPGKIRVTDACNQCGHCTATCTSNVIVHAEVKEFGMVVDPGCMKCMDCVSVCPNDALYFGFGKPAILAGPIRDDVSKIKINYSLTWPEEIGAAVVFAASYFAVWDVYQLVPMLMSLGIAMVTTFIAVRTYKLFRTKDLSFHRYNLKAAGTIKKAGWVFLIFAVLWLGLTAHSGFINYHERQGAAAFQLIKIPDELALAQLDPKQWIDQSDRNNIAGGREHLTTAMKAGLFVNETIAPKLAWMEYLLGNAGRAVELLERAAAYQTGQGKALSLYYKGAILNRLGRYDEAITSLDKAMAERPDLATALEEKGVSLWQLGRRDEAVAAWNSAVKANPRLPIANSMLAGAAALMKTTDPAPYEKQADQVTPNDPHFHYLLGLRMESVGMYELAEKHFSRAAQLDPKFRSRREIEMMSRPRK
ncbi:MAG TPA: tetratricopeptide repeat protein [Pyrinomonadaceae bacterium]|nr:tetratricopeptide repeat protein [Pyrinomonadaceae bacterium]